MVKKILNRKKLNPTLPVYTGNKIEEEAHVQLFQYNSESFIEQSEFEVSKFEGFEDSATCYWINFNGIHNIDLIKQACIKLGIHSLTIQDILDVNQRPKFQEYEDYWFFSIKSIIPSKNTLTDSEQISFVLGKNYLISFQEKKSDHFDHIRYRLREKVGLVRHRGSDLLLFTLLESILDNYFKAVDSIEKQVESFGNMLDGQTDPPPSVLQEIESYKRQTHHIRKTISPIKEFIQKIERMDESLVENRHKKYFFELKDICLTLLDDCDIIHVRLESSSNLFFSIQGHRMNQVMKTLTIVATIFIPLTFVAGVYGMNFANMPELTWKYGYYGVWFLMLLLLIAMIAYFRTKKWF